MKLWRKAYIHVYVYVYVYRPCPRASRSLLAHAKLRFWLEDPSLDVYTMGNIKHI